MNRDSPLQPSPERVEETGSSGLRSTPQPREVKPQFQASYFTCPRCGIASAQHWIDLHTVEMKYSKATQWRRTQTKMVDMALSQCGTCLKRALWFEKSLIFPASSTAPAMSPDMPAEFQKDYEEATAVAHASPRAAAALLRMCVEGLCKSITGEGRFENAIEALQKQGLPEEIQMAMDVIRLNGNQVMHAGQLYGEDDQHTVSMLFRLANSIVAWAITEKRQLRALYEQLPEEKRKHLEQKRAASTPP